MPGNVIGGKKAAATNKKRYGKDWYSRIGRIGGQMGAAEGVIKGFAAMDPEKRREAGRKGGSKSTRAGVKTGDGKTSRRIKK